MLLMLGAVSFAGTVLFSLSSCAGVTIKDSEWCGSLGSQGASCFHTLTTGSEQLTLQQWAERWDNLADPQVCSVVESFTDIKADVEELCSFNNVCTYDQTAQVQRISDKLNGVVSAAKKVKGK